MPERDRLRIQNTKIVYSDINTSPILGEPLSEERLKLLFDSILLAIADFPEFDEEELSIEDS